MHETIDHLGRVSWTCPRCAWRKAGRCWQCGATRTNDRKAGVYCVHCATRNSVQKKTRYAKSEMGQHKRRLYERQRSRRADVRERKAARLKAWRHADPSRLAVLAAKARERYWRQKAERAAEVPNASDVR